MDRHPAVLGGARVCCGLWLLSGQRARRFVANKSRREGDGDAARRRFRHRLFDDTRPKGRRQRPVPATFRAHSIERFNRSRTATKLAADDLIGRQGKVDRHAAVDTEMARDHRILCRQARTAAGPAILDPRRASRSSARSIPRSPTTELVDCHNKIQPGARLEGRRRRWAPLSSMRRQAPSSRRSKWECIGIAAGGFRTDRRRRVVDVGRVLTAASASASAPRSWRRPRTARIRVPRQYEPRAAHAARTRSSAFPR